MTIQNPEWQVKLNKRLESGDVIVPESIQTKLSSSGENSASERFYKQFDYRREGDQDRNVHENYLDYCYFIICHENFSGLPATMDQNTGRLYITTPDRKTDDLKQQREEWWRQKAKETGVNIDRKGWKLASPVN